MAWPAFEHWRERRRTREEKDNMEETGMSDFQFKSFLKQLVGRMEGARDEPDADEAKARLEEIIQDLRSDIES